MTEAAAARTARTANANTPTTLIKYTLTEGIWNMHIRMLNIQCIYFRKFYYISIHFLFGFSNIPLNYVVFVYRAFHLPLALLATICTCFKPHYLFNE